MPTLTITYTAEEAARIAVAYGSRLGLEGPATGAQVKQHIVKEIKDVVRQYEDRVARVAIVLPSDIEPT